MRRKKQRSKLQSIRSSIPRSGTRGAVPGTIEYVGAEADAPIHVSSIRYDKSRLELKDQVEVRDIPGQLKGAGVTWINVSGVHDPALVAGLAEVLSLHPLTAEDIANTTQRPKIEEFPNYVYISTKMVDQHDDRLQGEHLSIVLGRGWVATFQERHGDVFEPLRRRLQASLGRVRDSGADYLAFALLDAVLDNYFVVLELMGTEMAELEARLVAGEQEQITSEIYVQKTRIRQLKSILWPTRELVASFMKSEHPLLSKDLRSYLRDSYDHSVQALEALESLRETSSSLMDLHLSTVSNRTNEVMKTLTIFAALFIPLTFVAGVYGMNFEYMPELGWRWGYPAFWGLTGMVTAGMLIYFKIRKWW